MEKVKSDNVLNGRTILSVMLAQDKMAILFRTSEGDVAFLILHRCKESIRLTLQVLKVKWTQCVMSFQSAFQKKHRNNCDLIRFITFYA